MPLTDAQYEALADKYLISLYQELERDVIQDIARRVKKTTRLTETAELMAKHMREQGYPTDKIYSAVMKSLMADDAYQKEVAENTKAHKADIREKIKETMDQMGDAVKDMTQEVAEMSWNTDLSMWKQAGQDLSKPNQMSQLVAAASANTQKTLRNLTNTTGFKGTQLGTVGVTNAYQRVLDLALLKVATGTFSYDEACNDAVKKLAQSGLRTIDYKSGRSYQLDTAVRMCVRTANHQLSGKISEANCKATGQDLVITSQHIGARPEHVEVQNKVFSLSGKSKKYPAFRDPMPSEGGTGAGYGSVNGIMGVNCRHAFYPFFEGISEIPEDLKEPDPVKIDGKTYTYYEATQKQRAMERDIRALKREAYATDDPEEARALRRQADEKAVEYLDFSRKVGIRAKENRLVVVGDQASGMSKEKANPRKYSQSREQYDRYRKVLGDEAPKTFADFCKIKYNNRQEYGALKHMYRVANQYEANSGTMPASKITELHVEAVKQKALFNSRGRNGSNMGIMELDGQFFFSSSRANDIGDNGERNFKGDKKKLILLPSIQRFKTVPLGSHDRKYDAEAKLFEYAATMVNDGKPHTINLLSERCMCDSCCGVMKQFKEQYPNVEVNVFSHKAEKAKAHKNSNSTFEFDVKRVVANANKE